MSGSRMVRADPDGQIRRIARFIGPGLEDEDWLRSVVTIPRPPAAPNYERLGAAEREALTEACRPALERLGYPL